jgi:hypothetical protein
MAEANLTTVPHKSCTLVNDPNINSTHPHLRHLSGKIICTSDTATTAQHLPLDQQGFPVVGIPFGTKEYKQKYFSDKIELKYKPLFELLRHHPNQQQAYFLASKCADSFNHYWLRVMPPQDTATFAAQFDDLKLDFLMHHLAIPIASTEPSLQRAAIRARTFRPLRHGGLGFTDSTLLSAMAFAASITALATPTITQLWFPHLAPTFHIHLKNQPTAADNKNNIISGFRASINYLQTLNLSNSKFLRTWSAHDAATSGPLTLMDFDSSVSKSLATETHEELQAQLLASLAVAFEATPADSAARRAASHALKTNIVNSSQHCDILLRSPPCGDPVLTFEEDIWRDLLRFRLGLPFSGHQHLVDRCNCDLITENLNEPTINGYHALACSKLTHHHEAHYGMEVSIIRWVEDYAPHLSASREPRIDILSSNMRADVLIKGFQDGGPDVLIDTSTVQVYAKTYDSKVRSGPLKLAMAREKEKRDKYGPRMPLGRMFVPFVVEVTGGFGPAASELLTRLRKEAERHVGSPDRIQKLISHFVARHRSTYLSWVKKWQLQCTAT